MDVDMWLMFTQSLRRRSWKKNPYCSNKHGNKKEPLALIKRETINKKLIHNRNGLARAHKIKRLNEESQR